MSLSAPMQSACSTDQYTAAATRHESEQQSFSLNLETSALGEQQLYEHSVTSGRQHYTKNKQQFTCLYTKHKTQKRKVWLDGRLVVFGCGKVVLHAACPAPGSEDPALDQTELLRSDANAIRTNLQQNMETEKYLITIEGNWAGTPNVTATATLTAAPVSNGMRKILSNKFRRPASVAPPLLSAANSLLEHQRKRQRPLQPGELVSRYYPGGGASDMLQEQHETSHHFNDPSRRITSSHTSMQDPIHQQQNRWSVLPQETCNTTGTTQPLAMNHCSARHQYQPSPMPLTLHRAIESAPGRAFAQAPLFPPSSSSTQNPFVAEIHAVHTSAPPPKQLEQSVQNSASLVTVNRSKSATIFASNGFNESCFYGEDLEEDEELEEQSKPFQIQRLLLPRSTDQEPHCETSGSDTIVDNATGGKVLSRSTSQLLALFEVPDESEELNQSKDVCSEGFVLPAQDFSSSDESDSLT